MLAKSPVLALAEARTAVPVDHTGASASIDRIVSKSVDVVSGGGLRAERLAVSFRVDRPLYNLTGTTGVGDGAGEELLA